MTKTEALEILDAFQSSVLGMHSRICDIREFMKGVDNPALNSLDSKIFDLFQALELAEIEVDLS